MTDKLYARGYKVKPLDMPKQFISEFKYFQNTLRYGNGKSIPRPGSLESMLWAVYRLSTIMRKTTAKQHSLTYLRVS